MVQWSYGCGAKPISHLGGQWLTADEEGSEYKLDLSVSFLFSLQFVDRKIKYFLSKYFNYGIIKATLLFLLLRLKIFDGSLHIQLRVHVSFAN